MLGAHLMGIANSSGDTEARDGATSVLHCAPDTETAWHRSFSCLLGSAADFEAVGDTVNQALVKCNLGKLMRIGYLRLPLRSASRRREMYHKALEFYRSASCVLVKRAVHPEVWDMVQLELGGASLSFAALLQDGDMASGTDSGATSPAPSLDMAGESSANGGAPEQDLANLLQEAVDVFTRVVEKAETESAAQAQAHPKGAAAAKNSTSSTIKAAEGQLEQQQRTLRIRWQLAEAHHRLALLHRKAVQQLQAPVYAFQLAEHHYIKALELYNAPGVRSPLHILQVRVEWLALQMDGDPVLAGKDLDLKEESLRRALATLLRSCPVLREVAEIPMTDETGVRQRAALSSAMAKRCTNVLHNLVMLCKRQGARRDKELAAYKAGYGRALRGFGDTPTTGVVDGHSLSSVAGLQLLISRLDAVAEDVKDCLQQVA